MPISAHLLPPQAQHAEEMLERDRVYAQDRDRHERLLRERQNQETRELEKREKQHERLVEREREHRDREKLERDINKHFEESLKRALPQKVSAFIHFIPVFVTTLIIRGFFYC